MHPYLIQNPLALWGVRFVDALLGVVVKKSSKKEIPKPRRLILSNLAHLGDVLLMTSLLPMLKRELPELQIGVIVGSWSEAVVRDHPLINSVYLLDHWKMNREKQTRLQKWRRHQHMYQEVLREVRNSSYDISIECSPHFPNTIYLTYRAGIPTRIGYSSGGLGPLLTHEKVWEKKSQSMAEYAADLVSLVVARSDLKLTLPLLPKIEHPLPPNYLVVHMGSGNPEKEWPQEFWRELCQKLSQEGHFLIFTGKGEREVELVSFVSKGISRCLDFCNSLAWLETIELIRRSRLLIGVDSAAGHAAAAVDTPSVLIYSSLDLEPYWRPLSRKAYILVPTEGNNPRKISAEQVYQQVLHTLSCEFSKNPSRISFDDLPEQPTQFSPGRSCSDHTAS